MGTQAGYGQLDMADTIGSKTKRGGATEEDKRRSCGSDGGRRCVERRWERLGEPDWD